MNCSVRLRGNLFHADGNGASAEFQKKRFLYNRGRIYKTFFVSLRPSELPITGVQFILEVSIGRGGGVTSCSSVTLLSKV